MLNPNGIEVGDPILASPVGCGTLTGISSVGYPMVNHVTVTWCERPDGARYDPHRQAGGTCKPREDMTHEQTA